MKLYQRFLSIFYNEVGLLDLPHLQRNKIIQSLLLANIFFIIVIATFSFKIHNMVNYQHKIFSTQFVESRGAESINRQFLNRYTKPIYTQIFLQSQRLIDQKAEIMPIDFALVMSYPESWTGKSIMPQIDLNNGTLLSTDERIRQVKNGIVEDGILYSANIMTNYIPDMYPLDQQLLIVSFSAQDSNESNTNLYYFKIDKFQNLSKIKGRNYKLIKTGYISQAQSYSLQIGQDVKTYYDYITDCYLLFSHKNIYTYLKTTQYIILSILIAVFALLINPRIGDSISGRISVIGSSVFSLATNVFQINTLIKASSGITLIDLMSAFAGSVILVCFLITSATMHLKFTIYGCFGSCYSIQCYFL